MLVIFLAKKIPLSSQSLFLVEKAKISKHTPCLQIRVDLIAPQAAGSDAQQSVLAHGLLTGLAAE